MTDTPVNYGGRAYRACYVTMDEQTMGQRIATLMDARGMNQTGVANLLGVQRQTVHQWVHDMSQPTPVNLVMLAELLGTDVHYLVFGPSRQPAGGFPSSSSAPLESRRSQSTKRRRNKA